MNHEERAALIKHYADKISASVLRNSRDHRWHIEWAERIVELIKDEEPELHCMEASLATELGLR